MQFFVTLFSMAFLGTLWGSPPPITSVSHEQEYTFSYDNPDIAENEEAPVYKAVVEISRDNPSLFQRIFNFLSDRRVILSTLATVGVVSGALLFAQNGEEGNVNAYSFTETHGLRNGTMNSRSSPEALEATLQTTLSPVLEAFKEGFLTSFPKLTTPNISTVCPGIRDTDIPSGRSPHVPLANLFHDLGKRKIVCKLLGLNEGSHDMPSTPYQSAICPGLNNSFVHEHWTPPASEGVPETYREIREKVVTRRVLCRVAEAFSQKSE